MRGGGRRLQGGRLPERRGLEGAERMRADGSTGSEAASDGGKTKEVHAGHRKRMWDRVLRDSKHSFDSFHDHELLEMLLYFVNRQKNTNPIAHRLIEAFGSFGQVFEAPLDSLSAVPECGRQSALLLKLCCEIGVRCQREQAERQSSWKRITSSGEAAAFFRSRYLGRQQEVVMAAFLDNQGIVVGHVEFPPGQVNASSLDIREIVQRAVNVNAASVVLAHNHPKGEAFPSGSDFSATNGLHTVLYSMKIVLFDHVIFGEGGTYYSMRENGDLSPFRRA